MEDIKTNFEYCIAKCEKKRGYSQILSFDDLVKLSHDLESDLHKQAKQNGRFRAITTLHPIDENNISKSPTNIMLNYLLHDTWVVPHAHMHKDTFYYIISGAMLLLFVSKNEIEPFLLKAGDFFVVPKGIMHSDLILQDHCYVASAKNGGYDPVTDKAFLDTSGRYPPEEKDAYDHWFYNKASVLRIHEEWLAVAKKKYPEL